MRRVGHCVGCHHEVELADDGSCPNGHPPELIYNPHDADADATNPSSEARAVEPEDQPGDWNTRKFVMIVAVALLAAGAFVLIGVQLTAGRSGDSKVDRSRPNVRDALAAANDSTAEEPEQTAPGADDGSGGTATAGLPPGGILSIGIMAPTIVPGAVFDVDEHAYDNRLPEIGDIVLLASGGEPGVRRVIALPGQKVWVENGIFVVDGKRLEEPYVAYGSDYSNDYVWTVPDNGIFVAGDNRELLYDSWIWGKAPISALAGKITVISDPILRESEPPYNVSWLCGNWEATKGSQRFQGIHIGSLSSLDRTDVETADEGYGYISVWPDGDSILIESSDFDISMRCRVTKLTRTEMVLEGLGTYTCDRDRHVPLPSSSTSR